VIQESGYLPKKVMVIYEITHFITNFYAKHLALEEKSRMTFNLYPQLETNSELTLVFLPHSTKFHHVINMSHSLTDENIRNRQKPERSRR
jgi:hypothetical protein